MCIKNTIFGQDDFLCLIILQIYIVFPIQANYVRRLFIDLEAQL